MEKYKCCVICCDSYSKLYDKNFHDKKLIPCFAIILYIHMFYPGIEYEISEHKMKMINYLEKKFPNIRKFICIFVSDINHYFNCVKYRRDKCIKEIILTRNYPIDIKQDLCKILNVI